MMSPHEKASVLAHLEKAWEAVNELPTTTPCGSCRFHTNGLCYAYDGEKIPADVLPVGCEKFVFNPESAPF